MPHIFSVRELTLAVKATLEGEFPLVWVRGQISNLARPGSGHIYFTLKDTEATLGAVWFKSQQWQPEAVRESLADGQKVVCVGRLTVYAPRGAYQLVVEMIQDQGLGALYMAFEALKKRMAEDGYFDPARKRTLPPHPQRVAVITAPGSAALQDFLRLAGERGFGASIRVHPALVQGEQASGQIIQAVQTTNAQAWAEVIVLIRGGGSLEDLWAFNNEDLARALFLSEIPILTGIGHEVDTTIADLTADVRAATPSHAAQLLWPERRELAQAVDELENRLMVATRELLRRKEALLTGQSKALSWLSPRVRVLRAVERLERLERDLARCGLAMLQQRRSALLQTQTNLTRALDGRVWSAWQSRLDQCVQPLLAAGRQALLRGEHELAKLETAMNNLNPERPLEKGFCLVQSERTGRYLRDARDVRENDVVRIMPRTGSVVARVMETKQE
ncbi:exodeoxyribonuclease VII large subunit [Desulfonatronum thioautotrophicum]|uniref:exodeoxyribonuclease VII large subunit n=1 Tax=Desulfonatronum thioautotrophicum TaxID=617001 RepID=UPI0005EB5AA2|nr:exodeoxyribonuclease VII large subunit [Desulfonatronum thioautotrophicum]